MKHTLKLTSRHVAAGGLMPAPIMFVRLLLAGTVTATLLLAGNPVNGASTWYVTTTGAGDKNGTSWDHAYEGIQAAINAATTVAGDEVVVRAGVYDQGGMPVTTTFGMTNRVTINKAITVRSEHNDPENTIIKGAWDPVTTNGVAAVRAVYMPVAGARLYGFTLTNGATLCTVSYTGEFTEYRCGGGVYAHSSAVISNCVIIGNVGQSVGGIGGGGAWGGTFYDSYFINNSFANNPSHPFGGGTHNATLHRCHFIGNVAGRGGATSGGTLYNCVISNNVAQHVAGWTDQPQGGGTRNSTVYDSIIVGNQAERGGGAIGSTLFNCDIVDNTASVSGGGTDGGRLVDCRVIGNTATGTLGGGGMYGGIATNSIFAYNRATSMIAGGGVSRPARLVNCLVYGNVGRGGGVYLVNGNRIENSTIVGNEHSGILLEGWSETHIAHVVNSIVYGNDPVRDNWVKSGSPILVFEHTLTSPAQAGWDASNIVADPEFVAEGSDYGLDHIPGNYQLRASSPAVNAGQILGWMDADAVDLDGNPRIDRVTGKVDMGAYEYVYQSTILLVR